MIDRLVEKIKETKAPIVVGLDPMLKYVPEQVQKKAYAEYGETLEGAAEAIWQFNKEIVDNTFDLIPAVKPQIAMYEQFGLPGLMAFKKTVDYCKEKGLVVIGDIKRGDIGSTSAAYAAGHLGRVKVGSKEHIPFGEDFVTVNPYLGSDGVNPFLDVCREEKKGIFVLVKTSNPSSGGFQDQKIDGRPLYELVGEKVAAWGEALMGQSYSYVGAVVGATYPEMGKVLRKSCPKPIFWCRATAPRAERGKTWSISSMRMDWERSSIPPEGSSPPGSRRNMLLWSGTLWRGFQRSGTGYEERYPGSLWKTKRKRLEEKQKRGKAV